MCLNVKMSVAVGLSTLSLFCHPQWSQHQRLGQMRVNGGNKHKQVFDNSSLIQPDNGMFQCVMVCSRDCFRVLPFLVFTYIYGPSISSRVKHTFVARRSNLVHDFKISEISKNFPPFLSSSLVTKGRKEKQKYTLICHFFER